MVSKGDRYPTRVDDVHTHLDDGIGQIVEKQGGCDRLFPSHHMITNQGPCLRLILIRKEDTQDDTGFDNQCRAYSSSRELSNSSFAVRPLS